MKELKGNLFNPNSYMIMTPPTRGWIPISISPNAICITTNGFVKNNGCAVMGRGCAKEAADADPSLPRRLGTHLRANGPQVIILGHWMGQRHSIPLVTFPVKPQSIIFDGNNVVKHMRGRFQIGDTVPGWAAKASLPLILKSAKELADAADALGWIRVILPRPGCGAGELKWSDIKPALGEILDDRFYCISF